MDLIDHSKTEAVIGEDERYSKTIKKGICLLFMGIMVWWAYIVGSFMAFVAITNGMDNQLIIFMWGLSLLAIVLFVYNMKNIEEGL